MSLFRPDIWFPESVDYQVQFLARPIFLVDYTLATLLATFFLGVQLIAGGCIFRQYTIHPARNRTRGTSYQKKRISLDAWFYISMALVILYTASAVLACVAYGQRYASLARLGDFSRTKEETLQWFRDNPDHEGVKMICIPPSVGVGGQEFCKMFKNTKNLIHYKAVEFAYASVVEALIVTVDAILIYRFYVIFSTAKWIYPAVGVLSLASLTGPLIGIVALAKLAALGVKSDPWWSPNFPNKFLEWHSPWVAIVLPIFVNVVVTVAIITKIVRTRNRLRNLVGKLPIDGVYLGLTATLVESALPSALLGVLTAVISRAGPVPQVENPKVKFTPIMIWVAFTALSPQFIIIRVLQGRAWNKEIAGSAWSSPDMPLIFAQTQDTASSETVDNEPKAVP